MEEAIRIIINMRFLSANLPLIFNLRINKSSFLVGILTCLHPQKTVPPRNLCHFFCSCTCVVQKK
jgi:hypothetical protein